MGLVVGDGQAILERYILEVVKQKHFAGQRVAVGTFHGSFHIVVAQAGAVAQAFVSSFHGDIVTLSDAGAYRVFQPIGVHSAFDGELALVVEVLQALVKDCAFSVVKSGRLFIFQLFACVHQVVGSQVRRFDLQGALVAETEFARLDGLAGDDHHAVGTLGTIHGRGVGILQEGDALHLALVQVHEAGEGDFKAVKNEERLVGRALVVGAHLHVLHVGRQAGGATHGDARQAVRVGTDGDVVHDVEARVEVAQHGGQVLVAGCFQLLAGEGGGGSGVAFARLVEDTRHDHFIQLGLVFFQDDVAGHVLLSGGDGHFQRLHAHEREHEGSLLVGVERHDVFAVGTGDVARHFAFGHFFLDADTHAGDGHILFVPHIAGNHALFRGRQCFACFSQALDEDELSGFFVLEGLALEHDVERFGCGLVVDFGRHAEALHVFGVEVDFVARGIAHLFKDGGQRLLVETEGDAPPGLCLCGYTQEHTQQEEAPCEAAFPVGRAPFLIW